MFSNKHVSPHKATANVIDGVLIVSMPNAETPAVWRFDLSQVSIGGVEIRNDEGRFILGARNARGELQDIAAYPTRESATQALTEITAAMMNASSSRPAPASAAAMPQAHVAAAAMAQPRGFVSRWARRIGTVAIIVVALFGAVMMFAMSDFFKAGGTLSPGQTANSNVPASAGQSGTNSSRLGEIEPGVPASADDLLGGG